MNTCASRERSPALPPASTLLLILALAPSMGCKDEAKRPVASPRSGTSSGSGSGSGAVTSAPDAPPQSSAPPQSPAPPAPKLIKPEGLGKAAKQLTGQLARSQRRFALSLYRELSAKPDNLAFSPFSLANALSMTAAGARGSTRAAIFKALSVDLPPDKLPAAFAQLRAMLQTAKQAGQLELRSANRLFVDRRLTLRPYFPTLLATYYGAGAEGVDFDNRIAAAARINGWAKQETRGVIPTIVSPQALVRAKLAIGNAIYFKGQWLFKFKRRKTKPRDFRPAGGKPTFKTPTMFQLARFRYARTKEVELVELPYRGKRLAMVVLLPRKGKDLAALESTLTDARLQGWLTKLRRRRVYVYLPRFRLRWGASLRKPLEKLGMAQAFSQRADFSRIAGPPGWLYVHDVFHRAFVEVDEEGTKAAAVSAVVLHYKSMDAPPPQEIPVFRADHPFLFLIWERQSRAVLFFGRVATPAAKGR